MDLTPFVAPIVTAIITGGATYAHLEGGKFYVLHPNPVTELSGVSFSLNIPTWECGLD